MAPDDGLPRRRLDSLGVGSTARQLPVLSPQRFASVPGNRHKWFEGCLSHLAALFVMHRIAECWVETPPVHVYKAAQFAPNHATYAERIARKRSLPLGCSPAEWFSEHQEELEAVSDNQELNGTLAVALLPPFQADPTLWRDCASLNTWDPNKNETFVEYLDAWTASLSRQCLEPRVPAIVRDLLELDSCRDQLAAIAIPERLEA